MENIGVYYDVNKPIAASVAEQAIRVIEHSGAAAVCVPELDVTQIKELSAILAIGGDGTILRCAVRAARGSVPILGVNVGRVGFLSAANHEELDVAVRKTLQKEFRLDERSLLNIVADGESAMALNELLITRSPDDMHVLHLDVFVDGLLAVRWTCDGLIISTPTGASAYSLSAGGPIVAPNTNVTLITPVCAHSLSAKPLVVPSGAVVKVQIEEPKGALFADGQLFKARVVSRSCEITQAEQKAQFIRFQPENFFELVREKLK